MKVFITGINGFIGSALARSLSLRGHEIVGSVSASEKLRSAAGHSTQCYVVRMNEEFEPEIFRGVDTLVHCAYDLRKGKSLSNSEGTRKLARAAMNQGVKRQIYLGSYSAHEKATSEYGQTKLELEKFFEDLGQIVVKPGLVVGNGGIFRKMSTLVQKYPFVPLIDEGKGTMPIISISDLVNTLGKLIENPRPGCFRLYNPEEVSFKEILVAVKRAGKSRAFLVPVPTKLIYLALWIAGKLRLPLELDTGNLKGFQANQLVSGATDLLQFVPRPMSLDEMTACAIGPKRARRVDRK